MRRLIGAGARVDTANCYGVTRLALAATNGSAALVEALLAAGANAETASPGGDTPLMVAARTGRVDVLRLLLDASAAVDAIETWRGQTALMWATAENNVDAANALITAGADVEARSNGRLTPLLFAVREGHADAVRALLTADADVNGAARDGTTPLVLAWVAARPKHPDADIHWARRPPCLAGLTACATVADPWARAADPRDKASALLRRPEGLRHESGRSRRLNRTGNVGERMT